YRWTLSVVYDDLGLAEWKRQRPAEALAAFRQAEGLLQKLVDGDPAARGYRGSLATVSRRLGRLSREAGRLDDAWGYPCQAGGRAPGRGPPRDAGPAGALARERGGALRRRPRLRPDGGAADGAAGRAGPGRRTRPDRPAGRVPGRPARPGAAPHRPRPGPPA